MSKLQYVNLGCGARYHPDWINIDLAPASSQVQAHDLSRGIPLPDSSCGVVYHSHLLEHIRRDAALGFMKECVRVLKPGGVLRVAVPDLEYICRLYLEKLEGACQGRPDSVHDYHWMMLEMYDQVVREHWRSGMWTYLNDPAIPNPGFVRQRIGDFQADSTADAEKTVSKRLLLPLREAAKALLMRLMWAKPVRAWAIGRFRLSGENHHWMYDRFSLAQLMLASGLQNAKRQSAITSLIPNWVNFHLDVNSNGEVYKPDSLFMEATKL